MATYVIDKNEARVPFLGDRMSFITGLDPLGLQNTSNKVYTYLMAGLNNVTSHIRNYSFYCWLLDEYAKIITSTNPYEQQRFIRRAEYMIALLSYHSEILGINGRQYAQKRFEENLQEFDLEKGTFNTDGSTPNTYWQYYLGIFGQYYVGSLRQIGLIDEPINAEGKPLGIYRTTSSQEDINICGKDLAKAFDENISDDGKIKFLDCIAKGKVSIEELEELALDFNLKAIKKKSKECDLLIELLLDVNEPTLLKEEPSFSRKETLIHILKFLSNYSFEKFEQHDFTMFAYDVKGKVNGIIDETLTGWYLYQFSEYWQVALTGLFNGCLNWLEREKGPGWMPINEFVQGCTNDIIKYINNENLLDTDKGISDLVSDVEIYTEKELYVKLVRSKSEERMSYGLLLVLRLFKVNESYLPFLRSYSNNNEISNNQDNQEVLNYYLGFKSSLNLNLVTFISDFLLNKIIHRHQYVAYRKMGGGSQSTQKFIIEDGYLRIIGNFDPGFTSPRIVSLLEFLQDLNLLDKDFRLTDKGNELLNVYKDD
ncbi:hypothetical protein LCM02_04805 [Lutimonas saemankumensis]|uniref:hypothetical protein n=1 Tax=Lutimonas saemankumensis TaxID=483016 RepID=UPI001CD7B20B|nr:hypothetical protein [Lutimonas saemankumensis]MCA0931761.1 hypothetical protein [Lutimonas saemankumensis]